MSDDVQNMSSEELSSHIATLETKIAAHTDPTPEEPTLFQPARDKELNDTLGQSYDKAQSRQERIPPMAAREGENLRDRMERSYGWHNELSAAERKLQSDAAAEVADLKKIASDHNLTFEQAEQIKTNELLKQ